MRQPVSGEPGMRNGGELRDGNWRGDRRAIYGAQYP